MQALCLRNFFGCSGAGIDEVRKFQLSGYANHVCHPTPGHQILYLLRGWFFRGRWRLVLFKIHVVLKTRFGYFVLLTAERISNRGNRAPSWERLSLLVSVAVVAVLIAVPEYRLSRKALPDNNDFHKEAVEYFERSRKRLQIVATTRTPSGQILDWIPRESQVTVGGIAAPPPLLSARVARGKRHAESARFELEQHASARGPAGTVPVLRKDFTKIHVRRSLRDYLSKRRGRRHLSNRSPNGIFAPPPEENGSHRYAESSQRTFNFGGEGHISVYDPYTETSDDFSLMQIGIVNDEYDSSVFPGATFANLSTPGGTQFSILIKYQFFQGNWWFRAGDRWIGYCPASLYEGNRSGFWAEDGWQWAAYQRNLLFQDRSGALHDYSAGSTVVDSSNMCDLETHMLSETSWGSYQWLGGPGAH